MASTTPDTNPGQDQAHENKPFEGISYEDMSDKSDIPITVWKSSTDPKFWDRTIDITQPLEAKHVTTYFARSMMEAIWFKLDGKALRDSLREEFEGWTKYQFDMVNRSFRKRMIQILEGGGTQIPGQSISAKLTRVLDTTPPTLIETQSQGQEPEQEPVTRQPKAREQQQPRSSATQHSLADEEEASAIPTIEMPDRIRQSVAVEHQSLSRDGYRISATPATTQVSRATPSGSRTTQEVWNFPQPSQPIPRPPRTTVSPDFDLPPTRIIHNGVIDPSKISAFQKGWRSARNYTGKPYDILYDKARFFVSFCKRLQIQEDQYHAVFPDILSDRAEDFYMNHIGPDKRWDEIYRLLDDHFNTNTNHAQYWTDWTTTSFARARQDNPDKTLPEVLEITPDQGGGADQETSWSSTGPHDPSNRGQSRKSFRPALPWISVRGSGHRPTFGLEDAFMSRSWGRSAARCCFWLSVFSPCSRSLCSSALPWSPSQWLAC